MQKFIKNNWQWFYIISIIFIMLIGYNKVYAEQKKYQFQGVFTPQEILIAYCDNCYLKLSPEYLETRMVLAVNTDSQKELFKALQIASSANGWNLQKNKNGISVDLIKQDEDLVYFISCLDSLPRSTTIKALPYYLKSDSLKCLSKNLEYQYIQDSLKNIKPLNFRKYRLKYYSFTKSFTDKIGVSWNEILARGTLHNKPKIFDEWALYASETGDTTFTYRELTFSLDSTITIDWGSEEQTIKATYVNDGILYNEYEWRKYGLILDISRKNNNVKLSYVFRDKSQDVQLLQGQAIGLENDSLNLYGVYNYSWQREIGIPFVSRIPILAALFSQVQNMTDSRQFQIFLFPYDEKELDFNKDSTGVINDGKTKKDSVLVVNDSN